MESRVQLETRLQKERERLGELRKKHYELAGVAEGWGQDDQGEPHAAQTAGSWPL
jgi:huntingtin interacting protein 1